MLARLLTMWIILGGCWWCNIWVWLILFFLDSYIGLHVRDRHALVVQMVCLRYLRYPEGLWYSILLITTLWSRIFLNAVDALWTICPALIRFFVEHGKARYWVHFYFSFILMTYLNMYQSICRWYILSYSRHFIVELVLTLRIGMSGWMSQSLPPHFQYC